MEERWVLVSGLEVSHKCEFCWELLFRGKWAWKSSLREAYECDKCRREAVRRDKRVAALSAPSPQLSLLAPKKAPPPDLWEMLA